MSSLLESIEKELKRRAYEAMIHCLQSYQGQVEEAIEEFQHGTRAFYRANDEYVPHWQGEAREAYEWVYGDLRQIEACIDATADELLHEISREIARIQRKDRGAIMTTIRVKTEELETVAKHVPDAEDACQRARTSLSWELPSLAMKIPGIGSAVIHELTDELLYWLQRYEEKLNEAEELLYRTAAAIRQADQTLADNMKEFGLELLGWYDLQRVFGEYDPITGERILAGDRLLAGGMLLLTIIPPAKGAGIAGKVAVKGAKAAETAADVSKLVSQTKHVLRYDKMMSVFQAVYRQVVKAPIITQTLQYFKKQWNDLLASVPSVQWQPALDGIGPRDTEDNGRSRQLCPLLVGDEAGERNVWLLYIK